MIHPINIEADLLTANPKRPQLISLREKPKITYSENGRRLQNGKPTTPKTPHSLWASTFLRSFAHRLAAESSEDGRAQPDPLDSFVDVVDLRPQSRSRTSSISSGSSEDSALGTPLSLSPDRPAVDEHVLSSSLTMGPHARSPSAKIVRRTSSKVPKHLIQHLAKPCCSAVRSGFKEFLRFDFSNSTLFNDVSNQVLTPRTTGSRVWLQEQQNTASPSIASIAFKVLSVAEELNKLIIKAECSNPTDRPVQVELLFPVVMHVHVSATDDSVEPLLLIDQDQAPLQLSPGPHAVQFELDVSERIKEAASEADKFLVLSLHGHPVL